MNTSKTVLLNATDDTASAVSLNLPLYFPIVGHSIAQVLATDRHRWLGVLWSAKLSFSEALAQKIVCAQGEVASLAGLVASQAIPLAVAAIMFESKVEGRMRFGRWLLALCPDAEARLDNCYECWQGH